MRYSYGERGPKETNLYAARVVAYESLFVTLKSQLRHQIISKCGADAAKSVSQIKLSSSKIRLVVDRYINDLKRLKEMHIDVLNEFETSEKKLHRSKIAAYSMKWVLHEHPAFFAIDFEDFDKLPNYAKSILDDINLLFALEIIFYHLDFLDEERHHFEPNGKYSRVYHDLSYYIKTGSYNEKMASLLFDAMYANSIEYQNEHKKIEVIQ
jgi:hypothetical protein